MRQKLIEVKGELDKCSTVVEFSNSLLSVIDGSSTLKVSKEIDDLNSTINHIDLIDTYRILYQVVEDYAFFSNSYDSPR